MDRVITVSMKHEQPTHWIAREIEFCHRDGADSPPAAKPVCNLCDERIVELALRGEYALLRDVLTTILKEG